MAMTRTEMKEAAQEALMHGIGNILGYWEPKDAGVHLTEAEEEELQKIMRREADRIAKLFGYEKAWVN